MCFCYVTFWKSSKWFPFYKFSKYPSFSTIGFPFNEISVIIKCVITELDFTMFGSLLHLTGISYSNWRMYIHPTISWATVVTLCGKLYTSAYLHIFLVLPIVSYLKTENAQGTWPSSKINSSTRPVYSKIGRLSIPGRMLTQGLTKQRRPMQMVYDCSCWYRLIDLLKRMS